MGFVKSEAEPKADKPSIIKTETQQDEKNKSAPEDKDVLIAAAQKIISGPNQPAVADNSKKQQPEQQTGTFLFEITNKQLSWLIRFLNFVLIFSAVLYCLTMLFALKVSLLGRIGGINHISRAFFLSLLMLVFLLPWQKLFQGVVAGAMYTPGELLSACKIVKSCNIVGTVLFYLRFVGYWLLVMLLLILSQIRSARWARATLRRLEVI